VKFNVRRVSADRGSTLLGSGLVVPVDSDIMAPEILSGRR
jgi:hypothetical protein